VSVLRTVRRTAWFVLILVGSLWPATEARAQSAVGGGPLTGSLTDTEPTVGVLDVGLVKVAPGMTIREIGWDDNVFQEPTNQAPKSDWVLSVQPDISAFTRLRFVRISAYAGADLTYYKTYDSERSVGQSGRARVDFLLSRVRPFVGVGHNETRTRPNGEIDVRADRKEDELSGGLVFDLSPTSLVYASTARSRARYEDALEEGVNLEETMTRDVNNYQVGMKTDLTPLLSVQLFGSYQEELFPFEPIRNGEAKSATALFRIAQDAVVSGVINVSYRDATYADPLLKPFRGLVGSAAITYPFLEIGRLTLLASRGIEYSFDVAEGYYVEQLVSLAYTHRIVGDIDVQARGSRATFKYDARLTQPAHTDTLDVATGSVGYNLRNRTRVSLNYEYALRKSPTFSLRNYVRRRAFLSWQFAI
jgi:hypothetical protein